MDSLRPDRDEVDSFQRSRKAGSARKSDNKSNKKLERAAPMSESRSSKVKKTGSNTALWLMIVLIVAGTSFLGWGYYEQRVQVNVLNAELNETLVFVRQSKLLMARFEGQLSETGAEMSESGTDTQEKIKFLDAEVRKLWGISYDRNRKTIGSNAVEIKKNSSELKQLLSTNKKLVEGNKVLVQSNKKHSENLSRATKMIGDQQSLVETLKSEQAGLKKKSELLSDEIKQIGDASSVAIQAIRNEIKLLSQTNGMEGRLEQTEVAIEAIDASRLQLNERIVTLDRKLNDVQLSIKALNASGTGVSSQ